MQLLEVIYPLFMTGLKIEYCATCTIRSSSGMNTLSSGTGTTVQVQGNVLCTIVWRRGDRGVAVDCEHL